MADEKYQPMIKSLIRSIDANHHVGRIYDLGGLGAGLRLAGAPRGFKHIRRKKPRLWRQIREKEQGFLAFLDADCLVLQNFAEVEGDYDIGLIHDGDFHPWGGVIFINDTPGARLFLDRLIEDERNTDNGEQRALRDIINDPEIINGVVWKWFDAEKYCYCVNTETDIDKIDDPSIIHFSGNPKLWKMDRIRSKYQHLKYYENTRD